MADARRVIDYDDVIDAGARRFVATCTIDLQGLADDLAVSRATLYRVIPGRTACWRRPVAVRRTALRRRPGGSARRRRRPCRARAAVLRRDPDGAALSGGSSTRNPTSRPRVLFTPAGAVHERFVQANAELLRSVADSGELPFDLDTTAYVLSRVCESMWYADLLGQREPDLDVADRVARSVLTTGG